jgi:hypothetical protein
MSRRTLRLLCCSAGAGVVRPLVLVAAAAGVVAAAPGVAAEGEGARMLPDSGGVATRGGDALRVAAAGMGR